jgi:hypothetical protein
VNFEIKQARSYSLATLSSNQQSYRPISKQISIMYLRAALNLGKIKNREILQVVARIINAMISHALFATNDIKAQIVVVQNAMADFDNAMRQSPSLSKTDIKRTRDILNKVITLLASKVEAIANDPKTKDNKREAIFRHAGMAMRKKVKNRKKRVFEVSRDNVSGSMKLKAPTGAAAHEWHYTTDVDNFSNRITSPITTSSSTTISGLTSGVKYAFFHRAILTGGKEAKWDGPIILMVV